PGPRSGGPGGGAGVSRVTSGGRGVVLASGGFAVVLASGGFAAVLARGSFAAAVPFPALPGGGVGLGARPFAGFFAPFTFARAGFFARGSAMRARVASTERPFRR